jgi:hypothetical protein
MHPTRGINILLGDYIVAKTVPHGKLWRLKTVDGENQIHEIHALKTVGPKPKEPQQPKALSYDIWHRRYADLGPWNLQLVQKLVDGMAIDPATLPKEGYACEPCILGSQTRNLSDTPMTRCTVPGDRIHSDICGWIVPVALGDSRYILTFTDDATRVTYLFVLKTKTAKEVRECFLEFRNVFEQDGRRVKSIRTDGRGEYRKQMADLCHETWIHHEETAPYTPEQNGVAEWVNRTISERIQTILAETKLPKELWAELAYAVAYLKNCSSTSALKGKTPYEALYSKKPDVSHLIAIGTKAFVHTLKKKTKKLDPRSIEGIMVRYCGSNQYQIWIPGTNKIKVRVSRDVRFVDEDLQGPVGACGNADGDAVGLIIHNMIEVLPEPRGEPESKTEGSESESEESESKYESVREDGEGNGEIDNDNDLMIPRDATVEPEILEPAPPSPQLAQLARPPPPADPELRPQRNRKAPLRLNPGTYVSAQRESQSHTSHVYKADTTM